MGRPSPVAAALLIACSSTPLARAEGPEIKLSGLLQLWYTQMTSDALRLNSPAVPPSRYYNLRSEFVENGLYVRRAEIKVSGRAIPSVEFEVMVDPALGTGTSNLLQDVAILYKPTPRFELKVGQFKNAQTWEGLLSSSLIPLAERGQVTRVLGDVRDRGILASGLLGDAKGFSTRLSIGVFNGSGKSSEANAQKDLAGRLEASFRGQHRFGGSFLTGHTDLPDEGGLVPLAFAGTAPPPGEVLAAKDHTTILAAFYVFERAPVLLSAELVGGHLGRRFPSVGLQPGIAAREHLDQRILGVVLTGTVRRGRHTAVLRYDRADYNRGSRWYTAYNPYQESAPGVPRNGDYTPRYTEVTLGYTLALQPEQAPRANLRVNYVIRSKNFLLPRPGQTGAQGGDSLIAALQASF